MKFARLALAASFCTLSMMGAACSDDSSTGVLPCPRGEELDSRGQCVPSEDDDSGRGPTRPTTDTGTGADATDDTAPDAPVDVTLPDECRPFERRCITESTVAECADTGDAWTNSECPEGTRCNDGVCILPTDECTPGEILGCESQTQQRICADNGFDTEAVLCPPATPNCIDGACTDQLCEAGARRCDDDQVVRCAEDGESEEVIERCEFGCSAGRCVDPCATDGKDYLGCAFWAADLDNIGGIEPGTGADYAQFAVTISNGTESPVNVRVETGAGNVEWENPIEPGALQSVLLGPQNVDNTALTSNTYRITSDAPITVHQFNPLNNSGQFSNDASLLLPATSVGSEYIVNGWPTIRPDSDLKAFVAIIAVAEGTTEVDVTSPVATLAGGGVPALSPGVEQTFTMEQGQILSFTTNATTASGFTGMEILADQNVAVFSGSECANVPVDNNFCDHMEQQLFPVDTWGNEFVGAKFRARGGEPDVWRVVAAQDGTNVRTNPAIPVVNGRTLGRGEYVEFTTDLDFVLTADRPVSLAQFMVGSAYPGPENGCDLNALVPVTWGCAIDLTCGGTAIGDPAFLINVPTAQFRNDYIVLTPAQYQEDYMTMVARPGTTIRMDGREVTAARTTVAGWEILRVAASDGVHRIEASEPIGLYAYGYDCDVSYAYPGGLNLDSL